MLYEATRITGENRSTRYAKFLREFSHLHDLVGVLLSDEQIVRKTKRLLYEEKLRYDPEQVYRAMELFQQYVAEMKKSGIYDPKRKIPRESHKNAYWGSI